MCGHKHYSEIFHSSNLKRINQPVTIRMNSRESFLPLLAATLQFTNLVINLPVEMIEKDIALTLLLTVELKLGTRPSIHSSLTLIGIGLSGNFISMRVNIL